MSDKGKDYNIEGYDAEGNKSEEAITIGCKKCDTSVKDVVCLFIGLWIGIFIGYFLDLIERSI